MMVRARAVASILVAALSLSNDAAAQEALQPFAPPVGRIIVTERSDFSRYDDGHYVGHVYREARLNLAVSCQPDNSTIWRGEALVLEETMHDQRATARRLDTSLPVEFKAGVQGSTQVHGRRRLPDIAGVPRLLPPRVASRPLDG